MQARVILGRKSKLMRLKSEVDQQKKWYFKREGLSRSFLRCVCNSCIVFCDKNATRLSAVAVPHQHGLVMLFWGAVI